MAPLCRYQRSVVLDAPPELVFRFHEDPRNIHRISPPFLTAQVQRASPAARVGEEFALALGLFGFPLVQWIGVWCEVEPGRLLVDEARQSPFAFFHHEHRFDPLDPAADSDRPRTRMTDCVTYRLPGGWLGKILGETVVRAQWALAFADRHRRTRRWAAEQVASGSNLVK
jgi:ligand-binding SRPBCC domain-containing protein